MLYILTYCIYTHRTTQSSLQIAALRQEAGATPVTSVAELFDHQYVTCFAAMKNVGIYTGGPPRYEGFHSHGGTLKWMVYKGKSHSNG